MAAEIISRGFLPENLGRSRPHRASLSPFPTGPPTKAKGLTHLCPSPLLPKSHSLSSPYNVTNTNTRKLLKTLHLANRRKTYSSLVPKPVLSIPTQRGAILASGR
ncbi:hypothetical protein FPOAC2_05134 [Fusarium poae]|jgi:hypothetical protein